jgi:hypothetical protein
MQTDAVHVEGLKSLVDRADARHVTERNGHFTTICVSATESPECNGQRQRRGAA